MKALLQITGILIFIFTTNMSFACSVCFGGANKDSLVALKFAILLLLGVLLSVLAGIAAFGFNIWRRSHRMTPHS